MSGLNVCRCRSLGSENRLQAEALRLEKQAMQLADTLDKERKDHALVLADIRNALGLAIERLQIVDSIPATARFLAELQAVLGG